MEGNAYDGSSTESEYYEDADYDGQELQQSKEPAVHRGEAHIPAAASTSKCLPATKTSGNALPFSTQTSHDQQQFMTNDLSELLPMPSALTLTLEPSITTSGLGPEPPFDFDCLHCRATVRVTTYPSLFDRYHFVCRCCRIVLAGDFHEVEHEVHGDVCIRLCSACHEQNGPAFLAMIAKAKGPDELQCSGCKQIKPMPLFSKDQRINKPWEEIAGQNHFCFACVPPGAVVMRNTVVPKVVKCATCQELRPRSAFKHEYQRFGDNSTRLILEAFVCRRCMAEEHELRERLTCSVCAQLLKRTKFPKSQRRIAREVGWSRSSQDSTLVFTCEACLGISKPEKAQQPEAVKIKTLECSHCNKTLPETDFPSQQRSGAVKLENDGVNNGELQPQLCRPCLLGPLLKKNLDGLLMCTACCIPQESSAFSKTQRQMKLKATRRCKDCISAAQLQTTAVKTGCANSPAGTAKINVVTTTKVQTEGRESTLKRVHDEIQVAKDAVTEKAIKKERFD